MIPPAGPRLPRWAWGVAVFFLVGWNGYLAQYASPYTMTQTYDGAQYQLLARNRLAGHFEQGAETHTVRSEGSHPMWRPGLVWLLEGMGPLVGSVHTASWILSAVGTTFMELSLLWLSWRCFGRVAWTALLIGFGLPFHWNAIFLSLAIGQGPEPWSAAFILFGWGLFLRSVDRQSIVLALTAGAMLEAAEWFRTGNVLLIFVPGMIFLVAALVRREWRTSRYLLATFASVIAVGQVGNWLTASPVNKTMANLRGNLIEHYGPVLVEQREGVTQTQFLGGLQLAPEMRETYYDYIVRTSSLAAGKEFWKQHGLEIANLYFERLLEVAQNGASGLRILGGESMLLIALAQIVLLVRRPAPGLLTFAFACAFFAHYFGPVVLLRGDKPTHYLFVALPVLVLVASGGVASLAELLRPTLNNAPSMRSLLAFAGCLALIPAAVLSFGFYVGGVEIMKTEAAKARTHVAELDSLKLSGKRIAVRCMAWFPDRNVQTVLLPYARVPELEHYVTNQNVEGLLFRVEEKHKFFNATPYGSINDFEKALRASPLFAAPKVAGEWRWYPIAENRVARMAQPVNP